MTKITDQFRQRLSANAEDFDGIVSQILATMEEQEAQIAAMREAAEELAKRAASACDSLMSYQQDRRAPIQKAVIERKEKKAAELQTGINHVFATLPSDTGRDLLTELHQRRSGKLLPAGWNEYGLALGNGKGWVYGKTEALIALQDILTSALDWHPASEEPREEGSYVLFSMCDGFHVAEFVFYDDGGTSGFFHCFGGDVPDHVAWAKLVDPQALERHFGGEDAA